MRWILCVMLAGCSFSNVRCPNASSCTRSYEHPIIDAVVAGFLTAPAIAASADSDHGDVTGANLAAFVIPRALLIPAAIYAASAIFGFVRVRGCRQRAD